MRKTDLKIGEEYAVFLSPGAAKTFNQGRRGGTPFKVTLLAIEAVEKVWQASNYYSGSRPTSVKGIKVTIPSNNENNRSANATIEIYVNEQNVEQATEFGLKLLPADEESVYYQRGLRKMAYTREFLLLENAGCFVSTWADYLTEQAERDRRDEEANEQARQRRIAAEALAPVIQGKLDRVKARLAEFGEIEDTTNWHGDLDGGFVVTVEGRKIVAETYDTWGESDRVITGASFKLPLDAMARLLGIDG